MRTPGFNAEASIYKTRGYYHNYTAASLGHSSGVSSRQLTPQSCLPVGATCFGPSDCCTGWCNENQQCDCFDIGEECRFGPQSCCTGQCGVDGLCAPAASINVSWVPFHDGFNGLVIVTGRDFTPNTGVQVDVGNCIGPDPVKLGASTDANGEFTTWVECNCSGGTDVFACDQNGICASGSAQMPC